MVNPANCCASQGGNGVASRCSYEGCDRPHQSTRFHRVEAGQTAGGRNWSLLAGNVLCHACYCQYLKRGTLERTKNKPIAAGLRRCTLEGCERPDYGMAFYQIESGKNAGGRDWSILTGNVLCSACYQKFLRSGNLKSRVRLRGNSASAGDATVTRLAQTLPPQQQRHSERASWAPSAAFGGADAEFIETEREIGWAERALLTRHQAGERYCIIPQGGIEEEAEDPVCEGRTGVEGKRKAGEFVGRKVKRRGNLLLGAGGALDMLCEVCVKEGGLDKCS